MGCWRGLLATDCFSSFRPQVVRFKDSVQEFRYEPSSGLLPSISFRQCARIALEKSRSWRASQTLDGRRYYYNTAKREYCWELPEDVDGKVSQSVNVGDAVEVFCHSEKVWCLGYVERCLDSAVGVAFQMPGASSADWIKKELRLGHPDLRFASGAMPCVAPPSEPASPSRLRAGTGRPAELTPAAALGGGACCSSPAGGFVETDLPANWTSEEAAAYDGLFARAGRVGDAGGGGGLDVRAFAECFDQSGFQQKVLDGIWQVANPELKESLGQEEFRATCRLVAHCQALAAAGGKGAGALRRGGGRLRALLREQCLATPPPALPRLSPAVDAPG